MYEPTSHRVLTFNGRSNDSTVFDAKTGEIYAAAIPVGGKPEFAQADGKGHVYFNIEDKNEIGEIDAKAAALTKHYSIAPCVAPSGLAIKPEDQLPLFRLRQQNDDCERSGGQWQGDCDA